MESVKFDIEEDCWERVDDPFQGGGAVFYVKSNLKSEVFYLN